jgi:hypothetical protein
MDDFKAKIEYVIYNDIYNDIYYGIDIKSDTIIKELFIGVSKSVYVIILKTGYKKLPIKFKVCYRDELGCDGVPSGIFTKVDSIPLYITNDLKWNKITNFIPCVRDVYWQDVEYEDNFVNVYLI